MRFQRLKSVFTSYCTHKFTLTNFSSRNFSSSIQLQSRLKSPMATLSVATIKSLRFAKKIQNVGFVGLGNMGSRMANNLIKSGYEVSVCDVNIASVKPFLDRGVPVKQTPAEIAEASDVVITMLPSPSHVTNVFMGVNGLLHSSSSLRPWLFIDCSTIDPLTSRKVSLAVSDCSLKENLDFPERPMMLDAPVSGGILAAEAASLSFMVGGREDAYLVAEPLFLSMGRAPIYCGASGNGSVAKICNNLALSISMIGVSEALAIGQSLGVPATTLTKIFNSSSARCWSSDSYNPVPGVMEGVPSSKNYQGGFASKLMAKDLDLAAASAKEADVQHPLTRQAQQIYHEICKEGNELRDFSCVFREYYGGKDEFKGEDS